MFGFLWDVSQDGRIREQAEKIEELEQRIDVLEQWIRYFAEKEKESQALASQTKDQLNSVSKEPLE